MERDDGKDRFIMQFQTIASGSAGNCYFLTDGDSSLMIEAGVRKKVLVAKNIQLADLDGCLITHSHADHSKGVPCLIKSAVECFVSLGTAGELGVSGHRVHIVKAHEQFQVGQWKILPFDTIHDTAEPLGFLIQAPSGDKLLFATDTAYIKYKFRGLTHIAIECNFDSDLMREAVKNHETPSAVANRVYGSHMSLQTVKRMLAANDLSKVQEIHLLHLSDSNSDAGRFRNEIERQTGKPVCIAKSLNQEVYA